MNCYRINFGEKNLFCEYKEVKHLRKNENLNSRLINAFTLKAGLIICFLLFTFFSPAENLYSYKTGPWNDLDTWTTDPGGTTLVGSKVPENGDVVVILTSRTVTLYADITTTGLDITINSGGFLNLDTFSFTAGLSALRGKGSLKISGITFPTVTTNTFVQTGGGTVEYNNSSNFTLPTSQTEYNNLTLNMSTTAIIATQLNNLTLNGNLYVQKGVFQINDGSANRRQLTITGNVTVNSGSSITVGAGNTRTDATVTGITGGTAPFVNYYINNTHTVTVYGNFTNNGTVKFTNQTYPVFDAFPTNGAASVFFLGSTDNILTCNNTTDFYNLIVDKGTDQTYQLSINSADYYYFRLFGANISGGEGGGDNPILKKALWIRNGTLRLFGKVVIPSLSEGACDGGLSGGPNSDFYIPANAALVIEGPDVVVLTTADNYLEVNVAYGVNGGTGSVNGLNVGNCSSFSILGKLQVDDGYLSTRESGGLIYWASSSGEIIINGGNIDAKQFRTANSSGGLTAYRQTGGTLTLRGRFIRTVTGVASIADLIAVPLSTTQATNGINGNVGTFDIDRDDNIMEISGGTITILDVCGIDGSSISRAYEVNSLPAYVNVTGGTITIKPTDGTGTDYNYYIASAAPIYNLTIDRVSGTSTVQLTNIPAKTGVTLRSNPPLTVSNDLTFSNSATLVSNSYEVQVGGDFTLPSGSVYTPGTNNTTFNGSIDQTFTAATGTIPSDLYKLKINKTANTITFAGTLTPFTIRDSLQIFAGTLDDGGKTLNVAGHIYNAGTHTGSGKIVLNGSITQTIDADIFGSPALGNLELYNNTNPGAQLLNSVTASTLTLNASTTGGVTISIFDNVDKKLTLTGGVVLSSGNQPFGSSKMVRTDGSMSAKGLKVGLSLIGATSPDYLFPVGVGTNYSPFSLLTPGNPGTTTGFLTVIPVNSYHPTVSNTGRVIPFYWTIIAEDFSGATAAGFQYYFNYFGSITNNQNKACFLDYSADEGWNIGSGTVNTGNGNITFNTGLGFLSTDFTSGNNSAFNKPRMLYSRQDGNWNLATTWSEVAFGGAATGTAPKTYDRFLIGGSGGTNHQITITTSLTTISGVEIYSGEQVGITTGNPPTLIKPAGVTGITVTYVEGGGRYQQWDASLPTGDFDDFCNNNTAIFEYAGGTYSIPSTLTTYPNLHITANANSITKTFPNTNVLVRKNLVITAPAYTNNTLLYYDATRTLTVYGDVKINSTGRLRFNGNNAQTLNIYGDIDLRYNNTDNANTIDDNAGTGLHKVNFYGDSIIMGQSSIALDYATLTLYDSANVVVTDRTGGANTITFDRMVVSKEALTDTVFINHPLTIDGTTNSSPKALALGTGTLVLGNSTHSINLSSGGANFSIPQTSALILKNGATVTVTGSGTGIFLDGLLRAEDASTINLGDGSTADTRYIEYSGSGGAQIDLTSTANLTVNSQIRRSLTQTNGVLKFNQSGTSTSTIYGRGTSATRAKLEVVNSGSEFNMSGGTLTLIRGGGTTYGDLYIRPVTGSATGGTINLGTVDVGSQTIKFDSEIDLNNLTLNGVGTNNTFQLMVNPLILNGNLIISTSNSFFDANNINVTLKGDFTNNGTYTPGINTTTFDGTAQTLDGSTATEFYNLISSPSDTLYFIRDVTVKNNLTISSGKLSSSTYDIDVWRNIINNGVHLGDDASGGIIMNGTVQQEISGIGTFSRLELNNAAGARLLNSISLQKDFLLTNGVLNINQKLLTLGVNSDIVGSGFGPTKMIEPDGVFSNVGIKKTIPAGLQTFTFPLGVSNKYTPAKLFVTASAAQASVRINCINDNHPTVVDDTEVLQYYWEVEGSGISSFEGQLKFKYDPADVAGTEADYVAARLVIPDGTSWSKATPGSDATDNVFEASDTILFNFPAGTNNLSGEYTAGNDLAIPATVPIYTSNQDGDWDNVNIWTPTAPAGGPNGFIVIISPEDSVNTNGNRRFAYKTTINGVLDIGTSYGHNLGTVLGTGKLKLEGPILPAGRFTSFLTCAGGTLDYGGSSDYTIIADRLDTLRNLYFTGTGIRILPDKDLVICDTLKISGATLDNSVNERNLTINGLFQRLNAGVFTSGSNGASIIFAGYLGQTLGGVNGDFTGSNKFNRFEINNSSGLTLESPLEINGDLLLTSGNITTTSANMLKMLNGNATITPAGGSTASFVDGPMSKYIFGGNDFNSPSGKGSRYGNIQLLGVQIGTWQSEYFNSAYSDLTTSPVTFNVSTTEYWKITSPAATKTAKVKLRWDALSDVTPLTVTGGINDIRVAEFNGADWIEKTCDTPIGNNYAGTVQTTNTINVDPQYYTLGSLTAILAKARFTTTDAVCTGTSIPISFSGVTSSNLNFTISYKIESTAQTPITVSSLPFNLPTPTAGIYQLTGFSYSNPSSAGVVDNATVTVNAAPSPTLSSSDADNTFCGGTSVTFTAGGGISYNFRVNGSSVQSGASTTYITTTLTNGQTVDCIATNASGCSATSAGITNTVFTRLSATITGLATPSTICEGGIITINILITGTPNFNITIADNQGNTWNVPSLNHVSGTIYAFTVPDPLPWIRPSALPYTDYTFSVTALSDFIGCPSNISPDTVTVRVYKIPETGPQFHVPNSFGI